MPANLAYDLLAVDLDGTLLGSDHQLPLRNRDALHRAHEAGVRIVVCTGRSFTETRPILQQIGLDLDAAVTVSGALVNDVRSGDTLVRTEMSPAVARELTEWFRAAGFTVLWLVDRTVAGIDGHVIAGPRRHPAIDLWAELSPCELLFVDECPAAPPGPVRVTIVDEDEILADVDQRLTQEFDGQIAHNVLRVRAYGFTVVETFAPEVNKWFGIHQVCQRWGIDPRRTIAVGDDVNDIALLRQAGLGVAMANAAPLIRDLARRTTASNDDCGVALLIDELLSGQL